MIKKLSERGVDAIVRLHELAIFPLWDRLKRKYTREEIREFVVKTFKKGDVYGYVESNKLAGCVGIQKVGAITEVVFLLVNPDLQKKGIGRKLIGFVEQENLGNMRLSVLIDNPSLGFYKKMGYKIIGEGDGKYLMEKKLL